MAALASASVPRRRRGLTTQVPVALAALSIVLVAWEVVARTVLAQSEFVPTVGEVIDALAGLHNSGALWTSLAVTLQEFFVGLVIGLLGGLAIGVALAESHHADRLFSPSIWAIYGVPRVAFLPLLLIWFGTGLGSKVALVIIGVIFPVISSTYNGIRQTVPSHLNAAHSMLTSRRETFIKVYLPSMLPYLFEGTRQGAARGIVGAVIAEMYISQGGLGYLVMVSANTFQVAALVGVVILTFVLGVTLSQILLVLERSAQPWRAARAEQ